MRTLAAAVPLCALLFADAASAHLDVVFLLDTTGSMSGEIREAKERVRQIADTLRSERENERVRLGVVAFRDRGDAYVTQVSPLTEDTDESFRFLAALRADGGGDGPEDVLAGLQAALHEIEWDPSSGTERQIFLIGDAPPHLDYKDHVTPEELIRAAVDKRIVVNGVGCRSLGGGGKRFFQRVAYETEGAYHHIGRVRLGGDADGGLAHAMLQTLASGGDDLDAGRPVAIREASRAAPLGETLHAALSRDGARRAARRDAPRRALARRRALRARPHVARRARRGRDPARDARPRRARRHGRPGAGRGRHRALRAARVPAPHHPRPRPPGRVIMFCRAPHALAALVPLLLAAPSLAQDDRAAGLFAEARKLPLVEQSAHVTVAGAEARVHLVQVFANDADNIAQADYRLDLPRDATVTRFSFWQGDRMLEAELKEKDEAEREHARAAREGRATGLLKAADNAVSFSVYPVPAGERKRVEVEIRLPVQVEAGQSRVRLPFDRFLGEAPLFAPVVVDVRTADRLLSIGADGATPHVLAREAQRARVALSARRAVEVWWREEAPPLLVRAERTTLEGAARGLGVTIALNDAAGARGHDARLHLLLDGSFSMRRHRGALVDVVRRLQTRAGDRLTVHGVAADHRSLSGSPAAVVDAALAGELGHATDWERVSRALGGLGCSDVGVRCAVVTDTQLAGVAEAAKAEVPVLFFATADELSYVGDQLPDGARVYRPGADAESALYRLADELVLPTLHVLSVDLADAPLPRLGDARPLVPEGSALRLYSAGTLAGPLTVVMTLDGREIERTVTPVDLPAHSPEGRALRREVYRRQLAAWMKDYRQARDPKLKERIVATSLREEIPTALTSLHVADPALSLYAIKPGDPLLSVPAEPGLEHVLAFYPFGESRRLVRDDERDRFVDRFLVPRRWAERGYRVDVFKVFAGGRVQKEDVWYKLDETGPVARVSFDAARRELVVGTAGTTRDVGSVVVQTAGGRTLRLSPFGDEWRTRADRLGEHFTVHVRDRAGNRTSVRCLLAGDDFHVLADADTDAGDAAPRRPQRDRRALTVLATGPGARVTGKTVHVDTAGRTLRFSRDDADLRSLVVTATESLGKDRWLVGTRAGDLLRLDCVAGSCRARSLTSRFADHPITGLVYLGGERALVGVLGQGLYEVRGARVARSRWRVGSRFITGVEVADRDVLVGTAYNGLWRVVGGRAVRSAFPHEHVGSLDVSPDGVVVASGHGRWRRDARDRFTAVGGPVPGRDGSERYVAAAHFQDRVIIGSFDGGVLEWRDGRLTALPLGLGQGTALHVNALLPVGERLFIATEDGLYRTGADLRRAERVLPLPTYGLANKGGTVAAATKRGVWVGAAGGVLRRVDPQSGAVSGGFSTVAFHGGALYAGGLDGLFRLDDWRWALAEEGAARITEVGAAQGRSAGWVTALLSDGDRLLVGTYDEGVLTGDGARLAPVPGLEDTWVPFHGLVRTERALWVGGLGMGPARVTDDGVEHLTVPARDVFAITPVEGGVLLLTDEGIALAPDTGRVAKR